MFAQVATYAKILPCEDAVSNMDLDRDSVVSHYILTITSHEIVSFILFHDIQLYRYPHIQQLKKDCREVA